MIIKGMKSRAEKLSCFPASSFLPRLSVMNLGRGGGLWSDEAPKQLWEAVEGRGLAIFIRIAISGCFIRLVTPGKITSQKGFEGREETSTERSAPHPEHLGLTWLQKTTVCPGLSDLELKPSPLPRTFFFFFSGSHLRNLKSSLSFFIFVKLMVLLQADFISLNLVFTFETLNTSRIWPITYLYIPFVLYSQGLAQ